MVLDHMLIHTPVRRDLQLCPQPTLEPRLRRGLSLVVEQTAVQAFGTQGHCMS